MPRAEEVTTLKWTKQIIVYDDGEYSAIWGYYEEGKNPCLGVRWNRYDGGKELGFPNQFGYPVWYVEPNYLAKMILLGLYNRSLKNESQDEEYLKNLKTALQQCKEI